MIKFEKLNETVTTETEIVPAPSGKIYEHMSSIATEALQRASRYSIDHTLVGNPIERKENEVLGIEGRNGHGYMRSRAAAFATIEQGVKGGNGKCIEQAKALVKIELDNLIDSFGRSVDAYEEYKQSHPEELQRAQEIYSDIEAIEQDLARFTTDGLDTKYPSMVKSSNLRKESLEKELSETTLYYKRQSLISQQESIQELAGIYVGFGNLEVTDTSEPTTSEIEIKRPHTLGREVLELMEKLKEQPGNEALLALLEKCDQNRVYSKVVGIDVIQPDVFKSRRADHDRLITNHVEVLRLNYDISPHETPGNPNKSFIYIESWKLGAKSAVALENGNRLLPIAEVNSNGNSLSLRGLYLVEMSPEKIERVNREVAGGGREYNQTVVEDKYTSWEQLEIPDMY